jgi:hypothetical protein
LVCFLHEGNICTSIAHKQKTRYRTTMGCHLSTPRAGSDTDASDAGPPDLSCTVAPQEACITLSGPHAVARLAIMSPQPRRMIGEATDDAFAPDACSASVAPSSPSGCAALRCGTGGRHKKQRWVAGSGGPQQASPKLDRSAEINRAAHAKFKGNLLTAKR